jgi:hypothetical protein
MPGKPQFGVALSEFETQGLETIVFCLPWSCDLIVKDDKIPSSTTNGAFRIKSLLRLMPGSEP